MAMSSSANTMLVKAELFVPKVVDEESLTQFWGHPVPTQIRDSLSEDERQTIVNSIYMSTRRNWAITLVEWLCNQADVKGLEFLYSVDSDKIKWVFQQENYEEYYSLGFLLDANACKNGINSIKKVFLWAEQNLDFLSQPEYLGYYANKQEILEAIKNPPLCNKESMLTRVAYHGEDGDGPWFLFAWLHNLKWLFNSALIANHSVLHRTEFFGALPASLASLSEV
ncbi:hypothetical protein HQ393_06485 [Chitinibacter bivalviorum]|uniref:Uncharacterized protein n=1 Tax=Chitinibacter bivalviorum TaxID=2739434 RepID=A0A7H9BHB5_9NEIS|nr:hypothetical protein [Chitinibacter bivalviorum]QLG87939.1 hypothetical protein HQ393_06485 [Chitinibacter bivalviorum]